jgi:hypothetical protein
VKHFDEGELRRSIDEPQSLSADAREHLATCAECGAHAAALQADADNAAEALSGGIDVNIAQAQARFERAIAAPKRSARWYLPAGLAAAAAFALALVFTPLGGYANAFLTIFQPKEFVPIDLTQADFTRLRIAPDADQLGTMHVIVRQRRSTYTDLQTARVHLAFEPRVPSEIPSSVGRSRSYFVETPGEYAYTFSASKARAFEAKSHKTLPPMPPSLNGTTIHVRVGQTFGAHYGVAAHNRGEENHMGLMVVEMQVPTVRSTGASFQELERYMLAMPGISPDLATQLRALGDLENRMPVPVNVSKQSAQTVDVDGVRGLAIGDNTGLGAGVVWQKNGIVYGVMGGALTMDQVLSLANGLH